MRKVEYTVKVITETTVDTALLRNAMTDIIGVLSAEVTTFRILPNKKVAKVSA